MFAPKKIIVGVEMPESRPWDAANLGPCSRFAVRQAFDAAAAMSSTVCMVCVLPEVSAGLFGSEEKAQAEADADAIAAKGVLDDLAQQYQEKLGQQIAVEAQITAGRPWLEILKAAGPSQDNLIICGVRGKSTVSRLLFGSTGLKLLRNAACPVWLVKPRVDDDEAMDVLAATDLTEVGEDILFAAVALGQNLPVRLSVMNVIDDNLDRHMARTGVSQEELAELQQQRRTDAEEKLNTQLSLTDYRTVELGVQVKVAEGPADSCILSAIEELDIDLLVMATSGRGGIPGMLFGNTAERLLPELPCSILAIKPDDFQCPIDLG